MKNRNTITIFTAILFGLACFAFVPGAQAVVPAPDGGYPGGNTAEGTSALLSRTTGFYNTAVGIYSVLSLTDGNFCTGVGAGTLLLNTADQNTATGAGALLSNTTGINNTANGAFALFSNTDGSLNTASGRFALFLNTTGDSNTATGQSALENNTTGSNNTAIGDSALFNNTADGNTAIGSSALLNNTIGGTLENIQGVDVGPNVAVGQHALESNTVASANTAVGYHALQGFTTGPVGFEHLGLCTAVGFQALANATGAGFANSAFGYQALFNNTDGGANVAIGLQALFNNTVGSGNTAIGNTALFNSTGNANVALGQNAGAGVNTASNVICIGTPGFDVSDSCFIGNIYSNVQPIVGTDPDSVTILSNGRLGRGNVSSRRYKHDIKPMDKASEALFKLKPVSFHYNKEYDATQTLAFGLVAEEVAEVYPDLVGRNPQGEPESVRYDQVNAMLLNEFLKEHKKVEQQDCKLQSQGDVIQAQQATIEDLKSRVAQQQKSFQSQFAKQEKQMEALALGLQKVSAQLATASPSAGGVEANRPAQQVVLNNP